MNDLAGQKLRELIDRHGYTLCDDVQLTRSLLSDVAGEYKLELRLISGAQGERIPAELLDSTSAALPRELLFARLEQRLCENLGITSEAAAWATSTWALALGVEVPTRSGNSASAAKPTARPATGGAPAATTGNRRAIGYSEGPNPALSLAVQLDDLLFISGMGPIDPVTRMIPSQDIRDQVRVALNNLRSALMRAGSSLDNVLKVTCYLSDANDWVAYNEAYAKFFPSGFPARTTVVAPSPRSGVKVAFDAVAYKNI